MQLDGKGRRHRESAVAISSRRFSKGLPRPGRLITAVDSTGTAAFIGSKPDPASTVGSEPGPLLSLVADLAPLQPSGPLQT